MDLVGNNPFGRPLGGRWEAAGTLQRGLGRTGEGENEKKSKNFDGLVETIPVIPHNPCLG